MKYFFKDYKNYYYLPMEHMAIHKSMAAYVDDAHKEKATKDNAFTTKTGSFIPCPPGFHGEIFYDTDLKGTVFFRTAPNYTKNVSNPTPISLQS